MKILVTAGNTTTPIDRVRVITNVFTGRTGAAIACEAATRGHAVTLLTSHPETLPEPGGVTVKPYRSFDDLAALLEQEVTTGGYDAIVQAAAISDYLVKAVYQTEWCTRFEEIEGRWYGEVDPPQLQKLTGGKIKSNRDELWVRLVKAPKLIDRVRQPWGFTGVLVKFKLEVGLDDVELLTVADESRQHSGADLVVANTLEGMEHTAFLGPLDGGFDRVPRAELPPRLIEAVEAVARSRDG
jgi:phosphopantothenoylcysteine synthetase/decarboxylase